MAAEQSPLSAELKSDPLALGYAAFMPASPGNVADLLNAQTQTAVQSRFVNARTILNSLGATPGAAILDALSAAAASSSPVKWMMSFITSDSGVDLGTTVAQGMCDDLVTAAVFTQAQATALKGLAILPCSRAFVLGLPAVQVTDVIEAWNGNS